ncbi:MAG: hypothetical protein HOP34_09760 [Methylococcaceae bacterium]|nr:hypothetical protein [Methylococcaceae bacterium]
MNTLKLGNKIITDYPATETHWINPSKIKNHLKRFGLLYTFAVLVIGATIMQATQYRCYTYNQLGSDACVQYKCTSNCGNFPTNWKPSGKEWNGACPNKPPSNCPA